MVMDVMVPGGLEPGGRGVRATMKVRVMHAIVRHMITNDPRAVANPTDPELRAKFGQPINQEDMVYTLLTFSYVVIEGFRTMGYDMTEAQRDGYVHCWNVVGHLMGIRDELLPERFDDAAELFATIQRRQCGTSQAGVKLTRALIGAVEDALPGEHHDPLIAVLTRRLVGDTTADALEIPRPSLVQKIRLDAMLEAWEVAARAATRLHADRPFRFASEALHHAIMVKMGGMGGAAFDVPPEFVARWFPEGPPASGSSGGNA
jgi:hypothetical protein